MNAILKNKFLGFKRVVFSEDFIENEVKRTWLDAREKLFTNTLIETVLTDENNNPKVNKNGVISTSVNFPKSRDFKVFFRGTGKDSANKPLTINGISMYRQNLWIKGTEILNMLNNTDFI